VKWIEVDVDAVQLPTCVDAGDGLFGVHEIR
jgi:hypothetical protein